jgi:predicted DsbA family dithiol-disulfide isomerase
VIEVFADVSCPFAHVGLVRLRERRDALGSGQVIHVRSWPLELVNGEALTGPGITAKVAELRREVAPELFLGFDPDRFPPTTLPALALSSAAYAKDSRTGEQVSFALRHALFEEGRDISRVAELQRIAKRYDVAGPWNAGIVFDDWNEGRRRGVQGSPHFFVDGEGFFCPSLRIDHPTGGLHVTFDDARFEEFTRRAFPPSEPVAIGDLRR